jgi:hypothetical protein
MSVPSIPKSFTHRLHPEKTFDVETTMDGSLESILSGTVGAAHSGTLDTNLAGTVNTIHGGSLETKLSGSLETNNVLKLTGDPKEPVSTDSKIEILNLPRFTLQDIKDMMKVRMRIPNYSNVCFKVFGVEMFSLCLSGEGQVITEPYIPNSAERCEDNCCEPDTRPFPEAGKTTDTHQ